MPFGVGRYVRAHSSMRRQLSIMKRQLSTLERTREERDRARAAGLAYADAYRRLVAELAGERVRGRPGLLNPPAAKQLHVQLRRVRTARDQAVLVGRLSAGESWAEAVAAQVRQLLGSGAAGAATALADGLLADVATRAAGQLGRALIAVDQGSWELARACFGQLPAAMWRGCAAGDYFRAALAADRESALADLRRLVADPPGDLPPAGWVDLVGVAIGARAEELAAELFDMAETLAGKEPERWAVTAAPRDHLRPWIDRMRQPAPPPAAVPAGHVAFAVLGYQQPDRSEVSTDLGDYVQTLASLGHLARHRQVRFHGAPELAPVVARLRDRVRPELRLDTPGRDVTLIPVHRDATGYCAVPAPTWMLACGSYLRPAFGRFDFPLHPHLRPIFISFHYHRSQLLSPAAVEYLRAHSPIGCRDWTTVDLLSGAGVPAFFSGCVTTTLDTVFSDLSPLERPVPGALVAYVDAPPAHDNKAHTQICEEMPDRGVGPNLRQAMETLETYRRRYSAVVTSRLHCYLPMRSLGVPVQFVPGRTLDPRCDGLLDLDDVEVAAMADGIRTKVAPVLATILAGEREAAVYAIWREVCAEDVTAARARQSQPGRRRRRPETGAAGRSAAG